MAKKRTTETKRGKRKGSGTSLKKTLEAAITSNPFLNFFLSKCRVKGNAKLHKFAKKAGDQWKDMSYQEKTPYYLLADKAKAAPSKKKSRKRRYSESDIGEGSFSMITVAKKPDATKADTIEDDNKASANTDKGKTKEKQEDDQLVGEGSKRAEKTSEDKLEEVTKKQIHHIKPYKKVKPSDSSSVSTSFHSIESDDSVERASKRRGSIKCKSWTDSFDYMS